MCFKKIFLYQLLFVIDPNTNNLKMAKYHQIFVLFWPIHWSIIILWHSVFTVVSCLSDSLLSSCQCELTLQAALPRFGLHEDFLKAFTTSYCNASRQLHEVTHTPHKLSERNTNFSIHSCPYQLPSQSLVKLTKSLLNIVTCSLLCQIYKCTLYKN